MSKGQRWHKEDLVSLMIQEAAAMTEEQEATASSSRNSGGSGNGQVVASSSPLVSNAVKKTTSKNKNKKNKLIRPRGKRGGAKHHQKVVSKDKVTKLAAGPSEHSLKIAKYHAIEKQLARTTDAQERAELLELQQNLGGIDGYQDQSLTGSAKQKGGDSSKWLVQTLNDVKGKGKMRLLDVGALDGSAYEAYPWMDVTSIDINPRSEKVIKSDLFDFPAPEEGDEKYDVVSLSLVLNFIGDLHKRGEALTHAHSFLHSEGYLYLVLPLPCVTNSRYLDHERLKAILDSCGWKVLVNGDSSRLTRWLLQRKSVQEMSARTVPATDTATDQSRTRAKKGRKGRPQEAGWDGVMWKKEEIKVSATANNFCIRVG